NGEAERLRGPEINYEVKFRGLLDRQVGRLLAFENAASVDAGQAVRIGCARSVAHQTAGSGESVDRGNRVLCRERDYQIASAVEKCIGADDERADSLLSDGRKDRAEFRFRGGTQDTDLLSDSDRCQLGFSRFELGIRGFRVDQHADDRTRSLHAGFISSIANPIDRRSW